MQWTNLFQIPSQSFSWFDLGLIPLLFCLELLLSSDNAALLAAIASKLPKEQQKKALYVGMISSVLLRAAVILLASFLVFIWWVQLIGGVYLIFLSIKYLIHIQKHEQELNVKKRSFWKSVLVIEATDLVFAIDSILAAFALTAVYYPYEELTQKLWVIYLGGLFGVSMIRYASSKIIILLETYPSIEIVVYYLIAWIGLKLIVEGSLYFTSVPFIHTFFDLFFFVGAFIILIFGFLSTKWYWKV